MSDAVPAVPVSRLFVRDPAPPRRPDADLQQAAIEAAYEAGRDAAERLLAARIAGLEADLAATREAHAAAREAQAAQAAAAFAALEAAFADAIASLGLALAEAILAAEPGPKAETIAQLVCDALAGLPEDAGGTLRANPADIPLLPALPAGWTVAADTALAPGHVVAERGPALSAAGFAQRLDQLAQALGDAR